MASEEVIKVVENDVSFLSNISLNHTSSDFDISINDEKEKDDRKEIIQDLMQLYLRHNLTKKAVSDIAKTINKHSQKIKIPETKFRIFKEFVEDSAIEKYKYIFCAKCEEYSKQDYDKSDVKCECTTSLRNVKEHFIYFQVASQLKKIIGENFDKICSYKKIRRFYGAKKKHFYDLTMNTDGVLVHQSSQCSLWPVLLVCNFLPPNIRFRENNLIVSGLYYGSKKPDFIKFLNPLAEEFVQLSNDGISIRSECFRFIITVASLDLPAKCAVQQIIQYNGYFACSSCEHPGEKTSRGVRYTKRTTPDPLRSHAKMIAATQRFLTTKIPEKGVKGLSPMVGFTNFDLVKSFSIDYMHAICLGVMNNMISFWYDSKYHSKPYYISPQNKRLITVRLSKIKPCRFINRRLGPLDKYKQYKASQFRSLLLYFHPVLDGFLNKKYYNHLRLLSSSIYILLKPTVSQIELIKVKQDLEQFVTEYQ